MNEESSRTKRRKSPREKESFFSSTTLLALLGSIGVGAGIKYYVDMNKTGARVNRHKPFTGTQIKTHPVEAPDMKINETSAGFTGANDTIIGGTAATSIKDTTRTADTGKTAGAVGSIDRIDATFSKTNDDTNLKPITEVGKTATNT